MTKIENLSVEDIARGFTHDAASGVYSCLACGQAYESGEVYGMEGRFFEAPRAMERHMALSHGDYLQRLIDDDSKYSTLTDNQRQLMRLFAVGRPDKEIARELGVSASTVRHQKFMFREKAKQARRYLALYERVFADKPEGEEAIMPIHDHATMVDERYVVTEQERERILQASFRSLSPLELKVFPPKAKKKVVILARIAEQFEPGRTYTEREVNGILAGIYDDFVTIRRYLIEYGFMDRTRDSSSYWLK